MYVFALGYYPSPARREDASDVFIHLSVFRIYGLRSGAGRGLPPTAGHYLPHLFRGPWEKIGLEKSH